VGEDRLLLYCRSRASTCTGGPSSTDYTTTQSPPSILPRMTKRPRRDDLDGSMPLTGTETSPKKQRRTPRACDRCRLKRIKASSMKKQVAWLVLAANGRLTSVMVRHTVNHVSRATVLAYIRINEMLRARISKNPFCVLGYVPSDL
jgi:hypothetical protein